MQYNVNIKSTVLCTLFLFVCFGIHTFFRPFCNIYHSTLSIMYGISRKRFFMEFYYSDTNYSGIQS